LKALHHAGVKDNSIKGAIKTLIRSSANKLACEGGELISEKFGEILEAVFEAKYTDITKAGMAYLEQPLVGDRESVD